MGYPICREGGFQLHVQLHFKWGAKWGKLNDPRHRNRLVGDINMLDQDQTAQVGKDQEIKALSEINELQDFENDLWSHGTVYGTV